MIIIDTNVLSELMRPVPERSVILWLDAQSSLEVGITSITVAEILYGIAVLPKGKRKERLLEKSENLFDGIFCGRIFPFDKRAAVEYASIVAGRDTLGEPISMADAQIAAICRAGGFLLATRNVKDFKHLGLTLIDPWDE